MFVYSAIRICGCASFIVVSTTHGFGARGATLFRGLSSIGNLFGGMWAYQELGWGGLGAGILWRMHHLRPVTATAYLHSVMIQERRGMLKVWNIAPVMLTLLNGIWHLLNTVWSDDSVHTFASDIGDYFVNF